MKNRKKTKGEQRKEEIINAFYQVAKKEGLENTSIAMVAEKAGINPSLIIHYYNTREELLLSLNDFILKRYLDIYKTKEGKVDSREKLIEVIENLFSRKWNRLFDDGVFYSCYALIYQNKRFKKGFRKLHDLLRGELETTFENAINAGILKPANTTELVDLIFALVDGSYYYLGMVDEKKIRDEKVATYQQLAIGLLPFA